MRGLRDRSNESKTAAVIGTDRIKTAACSARAKQKHPDQAQMERERMDGINTWLAEFAEERKRGMHEEPKELRS